MSTKHFVFVVTATYKDPEGSTSGDPLEWFRYYKFDVEGGTYVRVGSKSLKGIRAGDTLWFAVGGKLLGHVVIQRIEAMEGAHGEVRELWYMGESIERLRWGIPYFGKEHDVVHSPSLLTAVSRFL